MQNDLSSKGVTWYQDVLPTEESSPKLPVTVPFIGRIGTVVNFFKKIFGKSTKQEIEPMHGSPVAQTQEEQDVTRQRMETEMAGQRAQREGSKVPETQESTKQSQ
jgi:hypothetical protein